MSTQPNKTHDLEYRDIHTIVRNQSVDKWIDLVGDSLETQEITYVDGVPMPTAPSIEFQRHFVGGHGKQTIQEASLFYKYVLAAIEKHEIKTSPRLLDFGCGWGRFIRLFLRDVEDGALFGIDPQARAIHSCRVHIPQASFIRTEPYPPLPFRDQYFDVVIAYSVFSHLAELPAYAWIHEIARVIKPNGLLIATTHPIWLLEKVENLRSGKEKIASAWHESLAKSWLDVPATKKKYEAGGFLFAREVGEYSEGYGDVIVSPDYINNVWGKVMEPVDFVSDPRKMAQAAFILKKRPI